MPQFTLDYSQTRPLPRRLVHRRRRVTSWAVLVIFCVLASGASLASTFVLARENRRLRHQRDAHALRYDSLLAAKLHNDRLLANAKKSGVARPPAASTDRAGVSNQQLIWP